jgi:hypothetical protein
MSKLNCMLIAFVVLQSSAFCQKPLDDEKPTLGLSLIEARDAAKIWKQSNLPMRLAPKKGMMISSVKPGSEASKAGIQQFDLLEKVGSASVRTIDRINELVVDKKPGDIVDLQIRRLANGAWLPVKGSMKCGTLRTNYYSQMQVSGSVTTGAMQISHMWFQGAKDYIAPIIVINEQKDIKLILEVSSVQSEALFPNNLQMRAGANKASIKLEALGGDTDILSDPVRVHQWQRSSIKDTDDIIKMLRDSTPKFYRLDGRTKYVEETIDETSQSALDVIFAVYDDMVATGNRDMTLGGRVNSMK